MFPRTDLHEYQIFLQWPSLSEKKSVILTNSLLVVVVVLCDRFCLLTNES